MSSPGTQTDSPTDVLENHPFAEIRVGDGASLQRQVTERDIQLFAAVSEDVNPAHSRIASCAIAMLLISHRLKELA